MPTEQSRDVHTKVFHGSEGNSFAVESNRITTTTKIMSPGRGPPVVDTRIPEATDLLAALPLPPSGVWKGAVRKRNCGALPLSLGRRYLRIS